MRTILEEIGEDVDRDGLKDTPERVARAYEELVAGYTLDPAKILRTFALEDGADEMVTVGPISFVSLCEHHLLPFIGEAWIGYVPGAGRVVGLSKFPRLLDVFARRLQVQERLTQQVADALTEHVKPIGVGVVLRARHLCMEIRGVQRVGAITTTTALRGALFEDAQARAEFLAAVGR